MTVLSGPVPADSEKADDVKLLQHAFSMLSGPIPPETEWTDVVKPVIEKRMQK